MTKEQLRMQMLAGVITESEYKAKLQENEKKENKESLNENFIGIGAINNPFADRKKEIYEDAFEHFLGQKYTLTEEIDEEQAETEESFEDVSLEEKMDEMEEGIHDKDITSAPHTNVKGEMGAYNPKQRAANLAKLQNFGPKDKK